MDAFKAFDFGSGARNLHIVGEAYSDYQGFIEGALNSAELALRTIAAPVVAEEGSEAAGLA
jgi:monoamine oxidase